MLTANCNRILGTPTILVYSSLHWAPLSGFPAHFSIIIMQTAYPTSQECYFLYFRDFFATKPQAYIGNRSSKSVGFMAHSDEGLRDYCAITGFALHTPDEADLLMRRAEGQIERTHHCAKINDTEKTLEKYVRYMCSNRCGPRVMRLTGMAQRARP